jgi:hypothetical protein
MQSAVRAAEAAGAAGAWAPLALADCLDAVTAFVEEPHDAARRRDMQRAVRTCGVRLRDPLALAAPADEAGYP